MVAILDALVGTACALVLDLADAAWAAGRGVVGRLRGRRAVGA